VGRRIQINDTIFGGECSQPGEKAVLRVDDKAASVEDKLVVATDGIAVDDGAGATLSGSLYERLTGLVLSFVPGTGGKVEQELNILRGEGGNWIFAITPAGGNRAVVPDIFADCDADPAALPLYHTGTFGGLEVALLFKDVVVREEGFTGEMANPAVFAPGGGVEKGAALGACGTFFDETDDRGCVSGGRGDFLKGGFVIGNETAFEKKVPRRVARDGEFREEDEIGTFGAKLLVGFKDKCLVAGEVANGSVDLGDTDFHVRIKQLFELVTCKGDLSINSPAVHLLECKYLTMIREFKVFSLFLCAGFIGLTADDPSEVSPVEGILVSDEPLHLSVADMVKLVKSQNLQLLIQSESVRRALEQSYQRRAALLPQFGLRARQARNQLAFDNFNGGVLAAAKPFNSFGSRVEGSLSLIDTQRYADYRLAKLAHAIEQYEYRVAVQDLLDQAVMLYFTQLRDLRQVEILEGNLEREEQLLELAKQQFDAGVAVKIDVTRVEVRLATVKRDLMEAKTAADDSILQLKSLLDIDLDHELLLDRSVVDGIQSPPSLKRYGMMADLTELRPELQSQERQLKQAELAKRAANWQRLPSVSLFGEWGYDGSEVFDSENGEAWVIGIEASLPIWEGGRIAAESREAELAVRQNELALRQLRNQINREFKFAMLDMDSRYEQIEFARDEVRLGMDEVEQARERYKEGLADNTEMIDAQQRLADAERSHLRAIYLYGLSRLAFARSIGSVERVLE